MFYPIFEQDTANYTVKSVWRWNEEKAAVKHNFELEKNQLKLPLEQVWQIADSYEKTGKRWKELTESVTYFLAKDNQAMYTVEKPGFKKMLKTFDARYKPPGRKYFNHYRYLVILQYWKII